jgi:NitT/TauT family transport system permease protein
MTNTRTRWLAVREPLPATANAWLGIASFLLPLLIWSALSYVPFFWHPLVLVTGAGDSSVAGEYSYIAEEQLVDREVFEARNAELSKAGAKLATGERANPIYFPPPHEVAQAFYKAFTTEPQRRGDYWLHESLWHSCQIIFWGFVSAAVFGLPLGILAGTFSIFARIFEPFVDFVRYMPAPVFGALAVAIFGLADEPKITIVFIGTFFQMVLVVSNTTRQVERGLLEAAQTLGANNRKLLTHVVLPGALPLLYRDMRILLGWAWTYLVVAELIGEKSGISAFIYQQQRYRNFENVYAAIVMIGVIGLVSDLILGWLGKHLFPWESGSVLVPRLKDKLRRTFKSAKAQDSAAESAPEAS